MGYLTKRFIGTLTKVYDLCPPDEQGICTLVQQHIDHWRTLRDTDVHPLLQFLLEEAHCIYLKSLDN